MPNPGEGEKKIEEEAYPPAGTQPDPKVATLSKELETLKGEKALLEKGNADLKLKVEELSKRLSDIDKLEKDKVLSAIVDERIAKGLSKVEDKDKLVERLNKLSKAELDVLSEDVKSLSVQPPVGEPKPKTAGVQPSEAERNLSDTEAKMRALRKEYFGHEDALK